MHIIKYAYVILSLTAYLTLGIILRVALFWAKPLTYIHTMNWLTYYLMHSFKWIGGFKIKLVGNTEILKQKGLFIVSTHIGYVDGFILGTLVPGTFTTKEKIKKSPLLGQVISVGGSIFIDRNKKGNIIHYVAEMARLLREGVNVYNFPEGHATDGTKVLKFFPAFFDAPLKTGAPIVPVTIDYQKINGKPITNPDDICCYDGKSSIFKHLGNLLKFKRIDVTITIHDVIDPDGYLKDTKGRRQISNLCMHTLADFKKVPIAQEHPLLIRHKKRHAPSSSLSDQEEASVR